MDSLLKLPVVVLLAVSMIWGQQIGQAPPDYGSRQGAYGQNPEQTRPDQGIARLSLINGEVSLRRGDSGDVIAAAMNAPLMAQDRVMTSSSARAELQFDAATLLRIGANSEVRIADLQYGHAQIQLALGTITLRILGNSQSQIEIDLPAVGFRPAGPGTYRITVREDGSGDITAREGSGQVLTQGGVENLQTGYMMMVRGAGADAEYQVVNAAAVDEWDRWNQQRDGAFLQSRSSRYVSPDIYGTESLDQNGRWMQDPTYGNVWAPNVPPGWAPYQAGQWTWEDYYGWTWVSNDPWGWAPYHYGRWFYGPVGWAWYPGPIFGHRYWSPALVGFFGFGGVGVGVGFGFGNIGWVPLAPFEVVHPWWGRGFGRGAVFNNTTIVRNVNITNVYRNARFANSVTAVGAGGFGTRSAAFQRLSGSQIQGAGLVRGALPVTATRASMTFNNRVVNTARLPQTPNRTFFSRPAAPTVTRPSAAGGWSRFSGTGAGSRPAPSPSYQAAPRSSWGTGSSQAVRISPPIVRSYSNGTVRGYSNGGAGGSGYRGTAAPAGNTQKPAPAARPSSGGGGRSVSGGGSHSGGGGHHR